MVSSCPSVKGMASKRTSLFRGVCFHRASKQWEANITVDKKKTYLGLYATAREAAVAYDAAVVRYRGAHAVVNFPEDGNTTVVYAAYLEAASVLRAATTIEERKEACSKLEALQERFNTACESERTTLLQR